MKILVISSNLIGDTVLSTGVIEHFFKKHPNSKFTFLIGPTSAQIYENFPGMEKTIIIEKKKFNFHWINIYLASRKEKWDLVIDLRSSIISYFLNTKKRYIFKKNPKIHHIKQLTKSFNLNSEKLHIYTSKSEEKKARENIDKNYRHIVIFPGGNWDPKIWPVEKYNYLLKNLLEKFKNIRFIIVGSSNERIKYYEKIKENLPKETFIDIMGESLTLTSAYMKFSDLFIGNDSGLMHLSVASKLKTIALFGPTNDIHYGHKSKNSFVIRTNENYDYFKKINIDKKKSYMISIKTDQILNVILKNKLL